MTLDEPTNHVKFYDKFTGEVAAPAYQNKRDLLLAVCPYHSMSQPSGGGMI